jgi:hypothetical protein
MNALFLSYLIQNNYLLKKEKNIYVKGLEERLVLGANIPY